MKLKGIELNGTYKVAFSDAWFEVYDGKDNKIYYENSNGKWSKREYGERNNQTYYEDSDGNWSKIKYDKNGNEIYFEDSYGYVADKRIKELTVGEIESLLGYKIKIKGEKKWEKNYKDLSMTLTSQKLD